MGRESTIDRKRGCNDVASSLPFNFITISRSILLVFVQLFEQHSLEQMEDVQFVSKIDLFHR